VAGLLVSVRNATEARIALDAGADLIDVKEPQNGSLGAPTRQAVADVVQAVGGVVPVSVALGELGDGTDVSGLLSVRGVQYAKTGLARVPGHWQKIWRGLIEHLPATVAPVAVGYADWRLAGAPSPADVLAAAPQVGCAAFLLDTYSKNGGGLLDCMTFEEVDGLVGRVKSAGMTSVVAGSLTTATIPQVVRTNPHYIAVRGAVCRGGRSGAVDSARVRQLADLVRPVDSTAIEDLTATK
jgi:uncharacterized protein (UPF0264 family)